MIFQAHPLYLDQSDQFEGRATIMLTSKDERGPYTLLDQTLFYPQGGGQLSDQGNIITEKGNLYIYHVRQAGAENRHYFESKDEDLNPGQQVFLQIDAEKRLQHTCARLL